MIGLLVMRGVGMKSFSLVLVAWVVCTGICPAMDGRPADPHLKQFRELCELDWEEVFYDPCTGPWTEHWTLDGKEATVSNGPLGMDLMAGPNRKENESHSVLWTKRSFRGDIRLDYEYTKLEDIVEAVTILYLQATGSGAPGYDKDIAKWADKREVPAMKTYFEHMNLLHISLAAFPVGGTDPEDDYIRARRYMPEREEGLEGTDFKPEYLKTGLFKKGVPHKLTVIKKSDDLFCFIRNPEKEFLCHWKTDSLPPVTEGRIGLRHMWTRGARYKDFRVFALRK
jgi:hypothetical protein